MTPGEKRKQKAQAQKKKVEAQRAAGLCRYPGCRSVPAEDKTMCQFHLDRATTYAKTAIYRSKKSPSGIRCHQPIRR